MKTVCLVQLGPPRRDLSLKVVARKCNRVQRKFGFEIIEDIGHLPQREAGGVFDFKTLADAMLDQRRKDAEDGVLVGVVDSVLTEKELFSAVTFDNSAILIATAGNDIEDLLKGEHKDITSYVVTEIAAQLLTLEYRQRANVQVDPNECGDPWHDQCKQCLFDYCEDPKETTKKLVVKNICEVCMGLLSKSNIPRSYIDACQQMIREGWRSKFNSFVRASAQDPLIRFSVPTLIGIGAWLGNGLPKWLGVHWAVVPGLMFVILIGLFASKWCKLFYGNQ